MLITLPKSLENDIMNFCKLNDIEDINFFLTKCIIDGFNIMKYGHNPLENMENENKPLKIEIHDDKEEIKPSRVEDAQPKKKRGRPRKTETEKEAIKQVEEAKEPVKPKRKIRIIKN